MRPIDNELCVDAVILEAAIKMHVHALVVNDDLAALHGRGVSPARAKCQAVEEARHVYAKGQIARGVRATLFVDDQLKVRAIERRGPRHVDGTLCRHSDDRHAQRAAPNRSAVWRVNVASLGQREQLDGNVFLQRERGVNAKSQRHVDAARSKLKVNQVGIPGQPKC